MAEIFLTSEIDDIRLSAVIFDEAFCMKQERDPKWALSKLRAVHQHSTYEVFFVSSGCLSIVTENETLSCEHSVAIIPPFVNHYTVARNIEGHCMYFTVEKSAKRQGNLYEAFFERMGGDVTVLPLTDDEKFYVEHMADSLVGHLPKDNILPLVTLLFSEMLSRILPRDASSPKPVGKQGKYINTIDQYLSDHYSENISLSDLAAELYLCEKQVSRIIKRGYGCSLSELVNRRRLAVACMFLRYTNMPISEVASSVGYEYENYFFTVFKKAYGVTPLKYRDGNAKDDVNQK